MLLSKKIHPLYKARSGLRLEVATRVPRFTRSVFYPSLKDGGGFYASPLEDKGPYDVDKHFAEVIERQRQSLLEAKRRQGQRVHQKSIEHLRYVAYDDYMNMLVRKELKGKFPLSFISPSYLPCTTPTEELRKVMIKDLQLETHHRGTYLLLRAIIPGIRMASIVAFMEDEKRNVMMVQLFHQEDEIERAATDIIGECTILLIKEPYFKFMGDDDYCLWIDHVSDVIQIKGDDPRVPKAWNTKSIHNEDSAESLKAKGNLSMGQKKYLDAITEYSEALKHPAGARQLDMIRCNRSLAFHKIKQFDAALSDSGFPNFNPNLNEMALFRAADALYSLGNFDECCQVLKLLLTKFPHKREASVALDRAQSRSLEQKTGVYDFKQLQAEATRLRPPHLDHATYIGPVEIRQTESKGRGLFVTKPVKAGDLLLCEKAFGHAHADEGGSMVMINVSTNQGFRGAQVDLINLIVRKLYRIPSLAPAFTTLYHGTYKAVSTPKVDGEPIVDTFLAHSIISFNCFGCSVSSVNSHLEMCGRQSPKSIQQREQAYDWCGIWTHGSYINHSCISNARRTFIGDMMIVRASRDMEAGTEITFWYDIPNGEDAMAMNEKLKQWKFVCGCALCVDARATEDFVFTERHKLIEKLKKASDVSTTRDWDMGKIERILDALNQTYAQPAEVVPRFLIWEPQLLLTRVYLDQNNTSKIMESALKVLTSLGYVVVGGDSSPTRFTIVRWGIVVDQLVETLLHIRTAFLKMSCEEDSERAKDYARTVYKIVVGEDESFEANYK